MSCTTYREQALRFGPDDRLTGIVTMPTTALAGAPCVVFVNAGVVHRVGPDRLYVDLARAIAAIGFPSLRFDLSGLGYSRPAAGTQSLDELVREDIRSALDMLVPMVPATHFVMVGLCSGANNSQRAALSDERITGLILIDPTVPRTWKGSLIHFTRRLKHPATLADLLLLRHPVLHRPFAIGAGSVVQQAAAEQVGDRALAEVPRELRRAFSESIQRVVARDVKLMMVFTGGVNHVYNYRKQLFDLLPDVDFRGLLHLEYLPNADHTVSDVANRRHLVQAVHTWLRRSFRASSNDDAPPPGIAGASAPRRELVL